MYIHTLDCFFFLFSLFYFRSYNAQLVGGKKKEIPYAIKNKFGLAYFSLVTDIVIIANKIISKENKDIIINSFF